MTDLLVKLFVQNKEDINKQKVRTQYGVLSSIVGVFCNLLLFLVKGIIGTVIHSISITADAFNNLSDAASGLISFFGVKLAEKPADKEHPFGHGRYEYIAALVVAFLVLQVGLSCFQSSIGRILNPMEVSFQPILLLILTFSVFIKVWLGFFNRKLGKRIDSAVMKATSADAFGDVLITSATVVSVIAGKITGLKVDGYMGAFVSILVLIAGVNIVKDTLEPLLGQAISPDTYHKICKMVEGYTGIVGTHDLIVHSYGPSNKMATIHAEVPNDIDIEYAHETIDQIEQDVRERLGIMLVIHMDPVDMNDCHVKAAKEIVICILKELEPQATIHDFRMVNGEERINLIFDLVLPYSYKEKEEEHLLLQTRKKIQEADEKYHCVINCERSYIAEK